MGGACNAKGKGMKWQKNFDSKALREETTL
jgi:hypothetical protein